MRDLWLPARSRLLTRLTIAYGISLFVWLSWEDRGWIVLGFGLGGAVLLAARAVPRLVSQRKLHRLLGMAGLGGLGGAGAGLFTVLLMFLKNAVHAHVYPDYSLALMVATAQRIPAWGIAGIFVGFAVSLLYFW